MEVAVVVSVVLLVFCSIFLFLYNLLWLKPQRLRSKLSSQGINGPSPSFPLGNVVEMMRMTAEQAGKTLTTRGHGEISHDLLQSLFPYLKQWTDQYGRNIVLSLGNFQVLYVTDPYLAKEISLCTSANLGRPDFNKKVLRPLLGNGILNSDGALWAHQRRTIAPEFYMDKIKGKVQLMVEAATKLVMTWKTEIERQGGIAEINPNDDMRTFSSSIISKTLLGKSHFEGTEIFLRFRDIQKTFAGQSWLGAIVGLSKFPTKTNRWKWRLEKDLRSMILNIAKDHMSDSSERDILHKIIEGARKDKQAVAGADAEEKFIVDNCKNVYFAGYESTAITALWTLMLLGLHPEWQARARAEVLEVCGKDCVPDFNMLGQMKVLTMIFQEVLRLYPPGNLIPMSALEEMKFKNIEIPKGLSIWISAMALHQDLEMWGADAKMFNPERFANGVLSACKVPQVYMPFGVGQHMCVGQHFVMLELKVVLSLILSNFSFSLSPSYAHSPVFETIIKPEHGISLIVKRL